MLGRRTPDGKSVIDYELGCVHSEVGVAYAGSGMYDLALRSFESSVETYKALPDYDEKWLGWPLPNIGLVLWLKGDYKGALEVLHQMREIYLREYGEDDRVTFK